jgi:predicted Zn-dependent peptidase
LAVSVTAGLQPFQRIGLFQVTATVKPGVDPAVVDKRLNEIVADYLAKGPTADEVRRAATVAAAGQIRALEKTGEEGGQAATLASGQLSARDPNFYRKTLQA